MGLDASVGDYEDENYLSFRIGSYSGFASWRKSIAKTQGFCLNDMVGYGGSVEWNDQKFKLILNHSDCDDEYAIEQIPKLIVELKEIQTLNVDTYDECYKFLKLCDAAIKYNKPIVFH